MFLPLLDPKTCCNGNFFLFQGGLNKPTEYNHNRGKTLDAFLRSSQSQPPLPESRTSRENTIFASADPSRCARNKKVLIALRFIITISLMLLKISAFLADWYIKEQFAENLVDKIMYSYYMYTYLLIIYVAELSCYGLYNVSVRTFLRKHFAKNKVKPFPPQND